MLQDKILRALNQKNSFPKSKTAKVQYGKKEWMRQMQNLADTTDAAHRSMEQNAIDRDLKKKIQARQEFTLYSSIRTRLRHESNEDANYGSLFAEGILKGVSAANILLIQNQQIPDSFAPKAEPPLTRSFKRSLHQKIQNKRLAADLSTYTSYDHGVGASLGLGLSKNCVPRPEQQGTGIESPGSKPFIRKDDKGNDILRLFPLVRFEGEQFSASYKEVPLSVLLLKGLAANQSPVENAEEDTTPQKSNTGQTP